MHAKQRNPSRIQAQEVAQKGPECDAKVCLTRPSNPLKTLGPEPRLVCFIQTITWGTIWTRKMCPKSVWPNELENDGVYVKTGRGRENRRWT